MSDYSDVEIQNTELSVRHSSNERDSYPEMLYSIFSCVYVSVF